MSLTWSIAAQVFNQIKPRVLAAIVVIKDLSNLGLNQYYITSLKYNVTGEKWYH